MSEFTGLSWDERAARLGCSVRDFLRIGRDDARIVADEALPNPDAVHRTAAWIAAGEPDVAPDRIAFCGADTVRDIVTATLADVPQSVRWFACTGVSIFEIGRADADGVPAAGYATTLDPRRALDGDRPHVVILDGRAADEALPSLLCHELAHCLFRAFPGLQTGALCRPLPPPPELPPMTQLDRDARILAVFDHDRDAVARLLFRGERWANEAARLWGHPCDGYWCSDANRLRLFRQRMDAAADLAMDIARETRAKFAAEDAAIEHVAAAVAIEGDPS